MAVQINWNICDNDKACGGISACPTGALYWNEVESKIGIINELCISCHLCVTDGCPVGAIIVTETEDEFEQARISLENDPHDRDQLFVDRFGAVPISDDILIDLDSLDEKMGQGITFVERFTDSSIQCLIHSIKVDDVRYETGLEFAFFKCEDTEAEETTEYPVLDIYIDGRLKGSIEGYFSEEQFQEFIERILCILR